MESHYTLRLVKLKEKQLSDLQELKEKPLQLHGSNTK
jgi:hypothetical protein